MKKFIKIPYHDYETFTNVLKELVINIDDISVILPHPSDENICIIKLKNNYTVYAACSMSDVLKLIQPDEELSDDSSEWNDARFVKPKHLQTCVVYDKHLKKERICFYDNISKYWCIGDVVKHDPNGDNHVSDYADYRMTKWKEFSDLIPYNKD